MPNDVQALEQLDARANRSYGQTQGTALGTADDLLASLPLTVASSLRIFAQEGTGAESVTPLSIDLVPNPDSARFVVRATRNCPANARCVPCPDLLKLDTEIQFRTGDGSFNEVLTGSVAYDGSSVYLEGDIPVAQLAGEYDASRLSAAYQDPELHIRASLLPESLGQLSLSGADAEQDSGTSASSGYIGEWPAH